MANIFWAMKDLRYPKMGFYTGTHLSRKDLIKEAVWNYGDPWKKLYRMGFRAVKVKVEEI